ncbi:hypothetical protein BDV41DRAFT_420718 [Aspergillus transmontanensis]|uniref:Uncharacterized protein n=1 Tax=Aspergillus transmontanensis TaxID=1034304 RepID=A0A5N6VNE1_9EURO|nr:hypothetical protein BDV41DRAFT_420718 [Aspergillus transmontanensis]
MLVVDQATDTSLLGIYTLHLHTLFTLFIHIRTRWVAGVLTMERLDGRMMVILRPTMTKMSTHPATSKMMALVAMPGRIRLLGMNRTMTTNAATVEVMVISHVTALSLARVWPASTAVRKVIAKQNAPSLVFSKALVASATRKVILLLSAPRDLPMCVRTAKWKVRPL